MKLRNAILCGLIALAAASVSIMEYVAGTRGMPFSLAGFPAQIVPFIIALCCVGILFVLAAASLIRRKGVGPALSWFTLSLVLFMFGFLGPISFGRRFFHAGFRHRIRSTVSPEELRQIARASHEILPPDKFLPGPNKRSLWIESGHPAKWNALTNSTALGKLDPSVIIMDHGDTVELSWGGALVGHWGVIIQINGKMKGGDIADDIKTVGSAN